MRDCVCKRKGGNAEEEREGKRETEQQRLYINVGLGCENQWIWVNYFLDINTNLTVGSGKIFFCEIMPRSEIKIWVTGLLFFCKTLKCSLS